MLLLKIHTSSRATKSNVFSLREFKLFLGLELIINSFIRYFNIIYLWSKELFVHVYILVFVYIYNIWKF